MKNVVKKPGERSFSFFEALISLGMITTIVIEVIGSQGNIANLTGYSRRASEAIRLAESVMSQVEYNWKKYDFKELKALQGKEKTFNFKDQGDDFDYTYNLELIDWKLDIFNLLFSGTLSGSTGGEEESDDGPQQAGDGGFSMVEGVLKEIFKDGMFKIAYVEVFWPEGARRNSVTLTYLLTNQRALNQAIFSKKEVYKKLKDHMIEEVEGKKQKSPGGNTGATGQSGNTGQSGDTGNIPDSN